MGNEYCLLRMHCTAFEAADTTPRNDRWYDMSTMSMLVPVLAETLMMSPKTLNIHSLVG